MPEEFCSLTAVLWHLPACGRPGAIAQLGERLLCKQEVVGSIPSGSTSARCARRTEDRGSSVVRLPSSCRGEKILQRLPLRLRCLFADIVKRRIFRTFRPQ